MASLRAALAEVEAIGRLSPDPVAYLRGLELPPGVELPPEELPPETEDSDALDEPQPEREPQRRGLRPDFPFPKRTS
jgi:hypothetical protein